ncbi:MAG: methyltransferase family protein [Hyphomicrobiales bacterium]
MSQAPSSGTTRDSAAIDPAHDNAGVVFPPPFVYALPFLAGVALHRWVGHDAFADAVHAATRPVGIGIVALGMLSSFSGIITFRLAHTAIIPHKPASRVVRHGPYRFTRNPMYLGLALVYLGLPLFFGYAWPYVLFPIAALSIDRNVIPKEEAYMARHFGDDYLRYKASVRRWI